MITIHRVIANKKVNSFNEPCFRLGLTPWQQRKASEQIIL
jgi:hypothetical protein